MYYPMVSVHFIRVELEVQRNVIWRSGESSTIHILSYFWALLLQVNTLAFGIFLLATVPLSVGESFNGSVSHSFRF